MILDWYKTRSCRKRAVDTPEGGKEEKVLLSVKTSGKMNNQMIRTRKSGGGGKKPRGFTVITPVS